MAIQRAHGNWMIATALIAGAAACGGVQPGSSTANAQLQQALMYTPEPPPGADGGTSGGTTTGSVDGGTTDVSGGGTTGGTVDDGGTTTGAVGGGMTSGAVDGGTTSGAVDGGTTDLTGGGTTGGTGGGTMGGNGGGATGGSSSGSNMPPCTSTTDPQTCDATSADGWMTGGGSVFTSDGIRVTHGFELHCDTTDPSQRLEVNWDHGHRFSLQQLQFAQCIKQSNTNAGDPAAGFNTFAGEGTGSYNGQDGATAEFVFTDDGEPGTNDVAIIVIQDASGQTVLQAQATLTYGNQQAHAGASTSSTTSTVN